ncbi:DUF5131 family protein [bacterium]|nr:DUF5131 family protein [bacterium]
MEFSYIGWTDHSMNFWWGCHKVSPACKYCYIGQIMRRSGREPFHGPIRTSEATWKKAFSWDRKAARLGRRYRVFTCSMSDFFHAKADRWRSEAWDVIRQCRHLDWQILTKRSHRIARCLPDDWGTGWPHVWLGVTVESQAYTNRLDDLIQIPAAVRFVSAEPLLETINITPWASDLDWVITGCERAAVEKRRPMDPDAVRSLREQCDRADVAFFLKQYYAGNQLQFDGQLDGVVRQAWPTQSSNLTLA